jgi:pyruvate/2-oxoglutarate dehydrogenase complex dihydrolipoamide acyltransferase (E2) component
MNSTEQFTTNWRKVATTIYKKPTDSKIFGGVEVDVTDLERFITEKRKSGQKITLTHFFVLVLARALKNEIPEFNTYVRRGKIVPRSNVDVALSVLQASGSMSSVIIPNADSLNFERIESFMNEEIIKSRGGGEKGSMQSKNILARMPWPLRNWFFRIYKLLTLTWGISIPGLGLTTTNSGSVLVTSIGSIGLDYGFPALLPTSTFSFVFVLGGIQKKPVVINDEIVIRRMMSLSIVIDHRVADASHGARLFRFIKNAIKNPEDYS